MNYTANIAGFEGQRLEVQVSSWTGPKLLVNGQPAMKGKNRGEMLLRRTDGLQVSAIWKPVFWGLDVPQLVVDGSVVNLVEPLKWYQWLWSGLPLALLFIGGALGGIIGGIAFWTNSQVFRSDFSGPVKYVLAGMISIIAVLIYLVAGILISTWLNG